MANILSMIDIDQKTSYELILEVASRVRSRRKELKLTQADLAKRSGMSLASYKRFEQSGQISFQSLVAIAIALNCEEDIDELFKHRQYSSIQEVLDANRKK